MKYKLRFNCSSFHDVVVEANNKKEAIQIGYTKAQCPQNGMEFAEFLDVEDDDEVDI
jgi:hypothetical protein